MGSKPNDWHIKGSSVTETMAHWLLPVVAAQHWDFIEIDFLLPQKFNLTYLRSISYISSPLGLMTSTPWQLEKAKRQYRSLLW